MIEQVLSFWFERHGPEQWWAKDPVFDEAIRTEFGALHASAALGELYDWRDGPEGRLAEIIVLDQFSRNLYREDPQRLRLRRHGAGVGAGVGTHAAPTGRSCWSAGSSSTCPTSTANRPASTRSP